MNHDGRRNLLALSLFGWIGLMLWRLVAPCPVVVYTRFEDDIEWRGVSVVKKPDLSTLLETLGEVLDA